MAAGFDQPSSCFHFDGLFLVPNAFVIIIIIIMMIIIQMIFKIRISDLIFISCWFDGAVS